MTSTSGPSAGTGSPIITAERMIFLGNLPNLDPNKATVGPDNAFSVTHGQTFGSTDNPLYSNQTNISLNDLNGDGFIPSDGENPSTEFISHNLSGSEQNYTVNTAFDAFLSTVRVQHPDGYIQEITSTLRVMQDSAGNTFLMPPPDGAPDYELQEMLTYPIVSVTFSNNEKNYNPCETGITPRKNCFPCFVRGTMIETEFGAIAVENLSEDMRVWTRDNGLQPIRWIGSRRLGADALARNEELKPIRIRAGALGNGTPTQDLIVSQQHRILVRSRIALKMFGSHEVLVAAKQLLQIPGIDIVTDTVEVEYFHFLFDRHEVVLSNGAETESLFTGPEALKALGPAVAQEIFTLFPELKNREAGYVPAGARHLASGRMGRKLAVRHLQNGRALVQ